jgi:hypothetical protein
MPTGSRAIPRGGGSSAGAVTDHAASTSQLGRFETGAMTSRATSTVPTAGATC